MTLLLLLAHVSHTPLPMLWQMTLNQLIAYCAEMPEVMKLTSPLGAIGDTQSGTGKPEVTAPSEIYALGAQLGILKKS